MKNLNPRFGLHIFATLAICLCNLVGFGGATEGVHASESPTGRRTTDRNADLIDALVDANLPNEALRICERELAGSTRGTPAFAAWSIRLSAVFLHQAQEAGPESDAAWIAADRPLREALSGYEDQPAALWLEFQQQIVNLGRMQCWGMKVLGNPTDQESQQQLMELSRATLQALKELDTKLEDWIPLASSGRLEQKLAASDLQTLQQSVRRKMLEGLLLQIDALDANSDDALALATSAEIAAKKLGESIALSDPSREAVERMLAEAYRRGKKPGQALRVLQQWLQQQGNIEPESLAQLILSHLDLEQWDDAENLLRKYYGDIPENALHSVAMDLARLRFLLRPNNDANTKATIVTGWVDAIGRRGGLFAKRRAETELLRSMRLDPNSGNLTVLTAQAGQLLRAGDQESTRQAAQLYLQATELAVQQGLNDQAFPLGVSAAAASIQAGDIVEGTQWLAQIAVKFPREEKAADLHFEAARQLGERIQSRSPNASIDAATDQQLLLETLERRLLDQLRYWPKAESTRTAQLWLLKLLEASKRYGEAASVALQLTGISVEWEKDIQNSSRLWQLAMLQASEVEERSEIALIGVTKLLELLESIKGAAQENTTAPLPANEDLEKATQSAMTEANLLAALGLDLNALRQNWITPENDVLKNPTVGFANDLRRVRIEPITPDAVALNPPIPTLAPEATQVIVDLAVARLHADAMLAPSNRNRLGRAILRVATGSPTSTQSQLVMRADALAWTGDWRKSVEQLEALASESKRKGEVIRHIAELLVTVSDSEAQKLSLEYWNKLSLGLPKGSREWYEAKLATALAMQASGDKEGAAKLARYVLLTQSPQDESLKKQFQAVASPLP